MSRTFLICLCLLQLSVTAIPAIAWRASDKRATILAPTEVRLDKTKTIPFTLTVKTRDGKPYSGPAELWVDRGQLVTASGLSYAPIEVEVRDGRAEGKASMGDREDVPSPVTIFATIGKDEVLASAKVKVRYPEHITISAPVDTVKADGKATPVIEVTIRDQFRKPLKDVALTVKMSGPQAQKLSLTAKTTRKGSARIKLPASHKSGHAFVQVTTRHVASQQVEITYAQAPPQP